MINIVRCKCPAMCSTMSCSCRKRGHSCFSACEHCRGNSCTNVRCVSAMQALRKMQLAARPAWMMCYMTAILNGWWKKLLIRLVCSLLIRPVCSLLRWGNLWQLRDRPMQLTATCSQVQIETDVCKFLTVVFSYSHTNSLHVCRVRQVYVLLNILKTALYKALYASCRLNFYLFNTTCLCLTACLVKLVVNVCV